MNRAETLLKYSILSLTVYFCCMAVVHFLDVKVPLLFIYYDVPSNHYQDLIISFCAFSFACFSYAAAMNKSTLSPFLIAMGGVILGLCNINASNSLATMIDGASTSAYWIQTALLAAFLVWLVFLHIQSPKASQNE